MADFLEYSAINAESKGAMSSGRIKMTDQNIVFKHDKTGKVEQLNAGDIEFVSYQKSIGCYGIRIFMKNGALHRFFGFKDDEEKLAEFFKKNYKLDMLEKELSYKGWNWGQVNFKGAVLSFDIDKKTAFEIPLNNVSQCQTGKNEVTLEFHQNDDAPVGLMEMRFHIPISETVEADPVEAFYNNVMDKASVISESGDTIAIFREIHCLTPRGRYDIKVFQTFFQLHGKTFDYKIPMSTVLRLFLLPHKDNRQMFFVISLDPPIKQGQTRYHFLVLLFGMEEETSLELPFTEEELKEKYEGKLTKEHSGPVYEVLGKIMKVIINRKLTGPANFIGHSGTPAVGCSYKAAAGYLYPLERGFIYVHKPPIHIRFEEIASVNFARSGGSTRSFDFEIELKSGNVYTFSSIEKEEYGKLYDFISSKKINVKNTGKNNASYTDDFGDSDNENEPDAYLERVKAEGKARDSDESVDDEESTDEDFNPDEAGSDVAEEYDSNPSTSESEAGDSDGDGAKKEKKKEKKEKKEKREKKTSTSGSKKKDKKKDANAPKRPTTAFMIWLNENREKIKEDNPGISFTDISKKGGELWKELKDKSEWENKAAKSKEEYLKAKKEYEARGGSSNADGAEKRKKESSKTKSPAKVSGAFKSKEYVSDDDSSSSNASTKPPKKKAKDEKTPTKKKESSGEEEDASGSGSEAESD